METSVAEQCQEKKSVQKGADGVKGWLQKLKKIKHIEIYFAVIVLLVVFLFYFGTSSKKDADTQAPVTREDYCQQIEEKLASVLSGIKGVGSVRVMIRFESSPEILIAYITTISGNSTSQSPQIIQQNGSQLPIILKTIYPKAVGCIVVAAGAEDQRVKLDLLRATSTVLDLGTEHIDVFPMNKK